MNIRRFLLTALGSLTVSSIFASCSQQSTQNSTNNTQTISQKEQKEVIKVGVTGILSQDILKFVNNNIAAKEGLEIQVVTFNDWIQPNTALRDKVIDANFFQHRPFMNNASKELNLKLVALNTVYMNTLGLFSNKLKSVSEIS